MRLSTEVQAFLRATSPVTSEGETYRPHSIRTMALTDREIETLRLLALGRHNKEIAKTMGVSNIHR